MPGAIGFKRHLRAEVVPGDATYLISERNVTALTGRLAERLTRLLVGGCDGTAVKNAALDSTTDADVAKALRDMMDADLLTALPDNSPADAATLAYWDAAGLHGSEVADILLSRRVQVTTVGDIDATATMEALENSGVRTANDGGHADLRIVLCADYLCPELADIDRANRETGRPWLLAKPQGTEVLVGPVFQPGDGPCWRCLADRVSLHRRTELAARARGSGKRSPGPKVRLPAVTIAASHIVAAEALKWLAGYRHDGQHTVWAQDSFTLSSSNHAVAARPQCPTCGDPSLLRKQACEPIILASRIKAPREHGGHRADTAERTYEKYRHLISPVTGVLAGIDRDSRDCGFLQSYHSGPNLALQHQTLDGTRSVLRSHSGGKGVTVTEAKTSALCEALERHSSSFHGDECRTRASFRSLGDKAIHPDACLLFDERQYTTRTEWNAAHSSMQHVPEPFDETAELDWTPVWSMTSRAHRLLPTSMLYFGAQGSLPSDSNGNAAGSCLEDAILQGMLEVVERDAIAIWWYNRLSVPEVDLDSLGEPWIEELKHHYVGIGREFWVLDVTSDLNIPVMAAVSRLTTGRGEEIMLGFGAHLDPRVAVLRALTELNQILPALIEQPRSFDDPDLDHWVRHATLVGQPYLVPDSSAARRDVAEYDCEINPDLAGDVRRLQGTLETAGHEVLVQDMTRPDIALPVVKVVVPGMRHFWARFAPGRLYDVPVRTGRLSRPNAYADINPIPLFL